MKKGDLISISFTGKETQSGNVFDTTHEDVAKKEGFYQEGRTYAPVTILVGNREILPGLDEALLHMKIGESKTIELPPEKAFGPRQSELIKVIPLAEFKKHNVPAVPGTIVNANDAMGKVQSVSGGRVRVDFNPELAGKSVEYEIKVEKHFTEEKDQLNALTEKMFPLKEKPHVKRDGEIVTVSGNVSLMTRYQRNLALFSKFVLETIPTVKKINLSSNVEKKDVEHAHVHEDGTLHSDEDHAGHTHEPKGHTH